MNFIWIISTALYFIFTYLIAKYLGSERRIGYTKSIYWSILFSPIIGLFITLSSSKIKLLAIKLNAK